MSKENMRFETSKVPYNNNFLIVEIVREGRRAAELGGWYSLDVSFIAPEWFLIVKIAYPEISKEIK